MRFTIETPVFMCGRQVYQLKHERLFLTRDLEDPLLQRPVPPAERSTLMYANVQDAYLEGKVTSKLEEVIAKVKMETCRMRSTHAIGRVGPNRGRATELHRRGDGPVGTRGLRHRHRGGL